MFLIREVFGRRTYPRHFIKKDFTKGDMRCPQCEVLFAREAVIHGKPTHKIIQGKVFVKK